MKSCLTGLGCFLSISFSVADRGHSRVLVFAAGSTSPSRVYGQGGSFSSCTATTSATGLSAPVAVAVDSTGGLYVGDFNNKRVLFFTPGNTTASRVYGQTSFTASSYGCGFAMFTYPTGVALDAGNNLYGRI